MGCTQRKHWRIFLTKVLTINHSFADPENRVAPKEPKTNRNDGPGYTITAQRLAQIRSYFMYWFFDQGPNDDQMGDYQKDIHASNPQLHKNFNYQLPFFGFRFNYTRVSSISTYDPLPEWYFQCTKDKSLLLLVHRKMLFTSCSLMGCKIFIFHTLSSDSTHIIKLCTLYLNAIKSPVGWFHGLTRNPINSLWHNSIWTHRHPTTLLWILSLYPSRCRCTDIWSSQTHPRITRTRWRSPWRTGRAATIPRSSASSSPSAASVVFRPQTLTSVHRESTSGKRIFPMNTAVKIVANLFAHTPGSRKKCHWHLTTQILVFMANHTLFGGGGFRKYIPKRIQETSYGMCVRIRWLGGIERPFLYACPFHGKLFIELPPRQMDSFTHYMGMGVWYLWKLYQMHNTNRIGSDKRSARSVARGIVH